MHPKAVLVWQNILLITEDRREQTFSAVGLIVLTLKALALTLAITLALTLTLAQTLAITGLMVLTLWDERHDAR